MDENIGGIGPVKVETGLRFVPPTATFITGSRRITDEPAVMFGLIFTPAATGNTLTIYEALFADANQIRFQGTALQNTTWDWQFPIGIVMRNGIYAAFSAANCTATIIWSPLAYYEKYR